MAETCFLLVAVWHYVVSTSVSQTWVSFSNVRLIFSLHILDDTSPPSEFSPSSGVMIPLFVLEQAISSFIQIKNEIS